MFGCRVKAPLISAICAYCGVFVSTAAASDLSKQLEGWGTAHASWGNELSTTSSVVEMFLADRAGGAGDLLMQMDDAGTVAHASWGNELPTHSSAVEMFLADRAGGAGDLLIQWGNPEAVTLVDWRSN